MVNEGQAILREYGIDPFFGKENLVWAPMRTKGQHHVNDLTQTVNSLKEARGLNLPKNEIINILKEAGIRASERR